MLTSNTRQNHCLTGGSGEQSRPTSEYESHLRADERKPEICLAEQLQSFRTARPLTGASRFHFFPLRSDFADVTDVIALQ